MEELNITVLIKARLSPAIHDYGQFVISLIPFLVEYTGGVLTLQEHLAIGWFTREELPHLDWAPADIPIVKELLHSSLISTP